MCAPDSFEVSYTINPWMQPQEWAAQAPELTHAATKGWQALVATFKQLGAQIEFVPPVAGLPDMVFTANAAVVLDRKALVARFRFPERQGETEHFAAFFDELAAKGYLDGVSVMPEGLCLEGAGDCVWDPVHKCFWLGYGPRSDQAAAALVEQTFGQTVHALELVNPRFYHMDTALCPLTGGEALVVESAFSAAGLDLIRSIIGPDKIIAVPPDDAATLSANAVCLGTDIVLCDASPALEAMMTQRGYRLHRVPLQPFALSGGSAFCLTLALDRRSNGP
jgi:N-dimethylarginine dimethylaminohydrolase